MTKTYDSNSIEIGIAYIHGRIEAQIESLAVSIGLPAAELTYRVGTLLCAKASGPVLGFGNPVPYVRETPTVRSSAPRTLALASGTHGSAARSGAPEINSTTGLNRSGNMRGMNQKSHEAAPPPVAPTPVATAPTALPTKQSSTQRAYWATFTAEERRTEFARRKKVAEKNRKKQQKFQAQAEVKTI